MNKVNGWNSKYTYLLKIKDINVKIILGLMYTRTYYIWHWLSLNAGKLVSNFLTHYISLAEITLLLMSHTLVHLPLAHHSQPPSRIHYFIPGSKLTFSTNLFHRSLLAPIRTAFSDYTWIGLLCSAIFIFSYVYFFLFWVRTTWISNGLIGSAPRQPVHHLSASFNLVK